jgi:hypothetical protein
MNQMAAVAAAYAIGAWVAAVVVVARFLRNQTTTIAGFFTLAGWAAVATVAAAAVVVAT